MKRLPIILLLSSLAFGQGAIVTPQQALKVVNGFSLPLPLATVTVCAANASGIPCTPALVGALFKDAALTQPLTNPFFADVNGNYQFAIAAGNYTVTTTAAGFTGYSYQISVSCPPSLSCTWTGNQSFNGNLTVTGNFTVNGGQNSLSFFKHNAVIWGGPESVKYPSAESGMLDSQCTTTPGGCKEEVTSNLNENLGATISLGNGTNTLFNHIHGNPGAHINCNITNGTACFTMNSASAISGEIPGESGNNIGGFLFSYPASANISCMFCVPGQNGGQSYVKLDTLFVAGNASATVPVVADLVSLNNQPIINNLYFGNFPSIGMQVRTVSNAAAVAGPMLFLNDWMDGSANTNAQPWVFTSSGNSTFAMTVVSGVANHPGSGKNMMVFNGNRTVASSALFGAKVIGTYFENLVNGSSIATKFADVEAGSLDTDVMSIQNTDTAIDISQSAAGRTCNIGVQNLHVNSPGNLMTTINNHISGFTNTGFINVPFYLYGGDGSAGNCGVDLMPFTIDSLEVNFFDRANHLAYRFPIGGNPTFRNFADVNNIQTIDSGATAGQTDGLDFNDRGTQEWQFVKNGSNQFQFQDAVNGFKTQIQLTQTANTPQVAFWRLGGTLGTTETTGQVGTLSAGWGTTATVSAASGNDMDWSFTISSTGTGQAANPTAVFTFNNGTWGNSPICNATRADVNTPQAATWTLTGATATAVTLNFIGTPVAATTYTINGHCGAR